MRLRRVICRYLRCKPKLKANIWQTIAQSDVDISAIPQEDMDKLVGVITDGILKEVDDVLTEASGKPASASSAQGDDDDETERILWEGRPFLSISVYYQITNERVRVIEGIFGKERHDTELVRIQDIDQKQNIAERTLNIGDIFIRSHDVTDPELTLNNVSDPVEVHEILRRAVLSARKKHKMSFREEM